MFLIAHWLIESERNHISYGKRVQLFIKYVISHLNRSEVTPLEDLVVEPPHEHSGLVAGLDPRQRDPGLVEEVGQLLGERVGDGGERPEEALAGAGHLAGHHVQGEGRLGGQDLGAGALRLVTMPYERGGR